MSPLFGGEFVVGFLALRIAVWIWRSRKDLGALARDDGPDGPDGGGRKSPPARPALLLVQPSAFVAEPELPRAA